METYKNIIKLTLGVFLFSSVIVFANSNDPIKKTKEKTSKEMVSIVSPLELNNEYISNVYDNASQKEEKFLSNIIAQYDVKNSSQFEGRRKDFTTIFKTNKGLAEVTYDNEGRVIAVEKRLKNVMLPTQIQQVVFKRYENWTIVNNEYNVSYKQGDEVKKSYIITVQNGNEKKRIRVNG